MIAESDISGDSSGDSAEASAAESEKSSAAKAEEPIKEDVAKTAPAKEEAPAAKAPSVSAIQEVLVPDLGEDSDVDVIDILVSVGDEINKEDGLVTLETDKAAMDVPSPAAGKVVAIKLKVGDKVSEGSLILELETAGEATAAEESAPEKSVSNDKAVAEEKPAAVTTPAPAKPVETRMHLELALPAEVMQMFMPVQPLENWPENWVFICPRSLAAVLAAE